MLTNWLILDVSSAPLPDAETYLEGTVRAPSNYGAEAAAKYIREKSAERLEMAAVDIDLAIVTGSAFKGSDEPSVTTSMLTDKWSEAALLDALRICASHHRPIVTFGGFNFDLPLLMRRARYLGLDFPAISLDRYKSPHVDLCELLSDRNPQRRRSLDFYTRRLGWTDLMPKPLSGHEESQVPVSGRWDELALSLKRDVEAIYRLACWAGVIEPVKVMDATQAEVGF